MGLAVIPDDWLGDYVELCVLWPDSVDWRAILRGLLVSPNDEDFWDKYTGTISDAQVAIIETFDQNLALQECTMIPTGAILPYGGSTAPTGFYLCEGEEVSRDTDAALFAAIGEVYGSGDGTTTFNLPDYRLRMPVGKASLSGFAMGDADGERLHTLTLDEIPSHAHGMGIKPSGDEATGYSLYTGAAFLDRVQINGGSNNTTSQGSNGQHNNMPPYLVSNFIIKR